MAESPDQIAAEVIPRPAEEWIPNLYLPYALYTIRDRALLLEDGFKPVNRRILWSLYNNGITPKAAYRKAARVAGDTVAYHPHGTSSIEDALGRMAQAFIQRVPLIDPYGSVGKVAGDMAAAARYWECRLNDASMELVRDLDEGGIEIGKNFDGSLPEPTRLPVRWPVGIINGTQGIAVGYAAKLWPHNPTEVMNAAIKLIENPNMTMKQLTKIIKGPDFPTGGELLGMDGVEEYLSTGSGTFIIRGRYEITQLPRGRNRITFYELPYQVSAESVIIAVRKAQATGKSRLNDISILKDLTDKRNGLRLTMETKAGSNISAIMAELFKKTPVETKFPTNSTIIVDGAPVVQNMLDQLKNFLVFRKHIVKNKAISRLAKIANRILQVDALLAALVDIDKAIAIIRKSDTADDAEVKLMKHFKINKKQAEYILSMQLRRLTKADAAALGDEKARLLQEKEDCEKILADDEVALNERVKFELKETRKVIGDERRTVISGLSNEDLKEQEKELAQSARAAEKDMPCYITKLRNGKMIRTKDRDVCGADSISLKHGPVVETIKTSTQSELAVVFANGTAKKIPANFFPEDKPVGAKELGFDSANSIVGIAKIETDKYDVGLAIVTTHGEIKIAKSDFGNKDEFPVVALKDGDSIAATLWIGRSLKGKKFVMVSSSSMALAFDAESIRVSGSKAGAVKGMNLKNANEKIIAFGLVEKPSDYSIISEGSKTIKVTPVIEIPVKNKGGMGVVLHKLKANEKQHLTNAFVGSDLFMAMAGTPNALSLTPSSKRAVTGTELEMRVVYGSLVAPNN